MGVNGVSAEQRHTHGRRCPICGGADRDQRGKGRRCHGFVSGDGYAHCSREEHSGGLMITKGDAYGHRLVGPCNCGTTHSSDDSGWKDIEAAYDYRDERGMLLFQVVRLVGKNFRQRKPDGYGGFDWSTAGVRRVLYQLPALLAAPRDAMFYIVEGEKDADTIRAAGGIATCNPMGAGKWSMVDENARQALAGRHVVIILDRDDAGRAHGAQVAAALHGVAATLRLLELPKKDVTEWFEAGGTLAELQQIAEHVEPASVAETTPTFAADIAQALADVRGALHSSASSSQREPLFYDAAALFVRDYPSAIWAVHGLITRGGQCTIGGEPKAATKTWIATDVAVAVATGTKALGEFAAEQGTVAYFYAEDLDRQVRNRIRAVLAGRGLGPDALGGRLHVCPRGKFIDVMQDEDLALIVASCRRIGKIDLLVLDPLRDISSAAEDKSDEMSRVMRRLRLLGELLGCTVAVNHHMGKASEGTAGRRPGQKLRGSGSIHGSTDSGIYVQDAKGNGETTFQNVIVSEVKGARSAGRFVLELAIEDDSGGEAVCATWRYSRQGKSDIETQVQKDAKVAWEFVRMLAMRGERCSVRQLRAHDELPAPLTDHRMRAALDLLLGQTEMGLPRLEKDGAKVVLPQQSSREN